MFSSEHYRLRQTGIGSEKNVKSYEEKLKELAMFCLKKLKGDMIELFRYLKVLQETFKTML